MMGRNLRCDAVCFLEYESVAGVDFKSIRNDLIFKYVGDDFITVKGFKYG